ncbi:hypothetical protein TIFTF001_027841 [Ficus carica]|uniref:Uncharacterized protein n=1 Tax=Ficus carica TaxID=3494 RepID=A0AA88DNW2_FICCA|nr:hypothetical protein TIFTF001_027841 [Ficus carica]
MRKSPPLPDVYAIAVDFYFAHLVTSPSEEWLIRAIALYDDASEEGQLHLKTKFEMAMNKLLPRENIYFSRAGPKRQDTKPPGAFIMSFVCHPEKGLQNHWNPNISHKETSLHAHRTFLETPEASNACSNELRVSSYGLVDNDRDIFLSLT